MAWYPITALLLLCWMGFFRPAIGKIYERCELARELRDIHEIPEDQLATWVCIARHESLFNTSARNLGSGDHGLFQISQLYWCSPPGEGYACGLPCSALWDDDIEDDVICARRIYREHKRLSGDGFNAWVVYNRDCRDKERVQSYIEGCFDEDNAVKHGTTTETIRTTEDDSRFDLVTKPVDVKAYQRRLKGIFDYFKGPSTSTSFGKEAHRFKLNSYERRITNILELFSAFKSSDNATADTGTLYSTPSTTTRYTTPSTTRYTTSTTRYTSPATRNTIHITTPISLGKESHGLKSNTYQGRLFNTLELFRGFKSSGAGSNIIPSATTVYTTPSTTHQTTSTTNYTTPRTTYRYTFLSTTPRPLLSTKSTTTTTAKPISTFKPFTNFSTFKPFNTFQPSSAAKLSNTVGPSSTVKPSSTFKPFTFKAFSTSKPFSTLKYFNTLKPFSTSTIFPTKKPAEPSSVTPQPYFHRFNAFSFGNDNKDQSYSKPFSQYTITTTTKTSASPRTTTSRTTTPRTSTTRPTTSRIIPTSTTAKRYFTLRTTPSTSTTITTIPKLATLKTTSFKPFSFKPFYVITLKPTVQTTTARPAFETSTSSTFQPFWLTSKSNAASSKKPFSFTLKPLFSTAKTVVSSTVKPVILNEVPNLALSTRLITTSSTPRTSEPHVQKFTLDGKSDVSFHRKSNGFSFRLVRNI